MSPFCSFIFHKIHIYEISKLRKFLDKKWVFGQYESMHSDHFIFPKKRLLCKSVDLDTLCFPISFSRKKLSMDFSLKYLYPQHHPKWEEFANMSLSQYGAFIHHKWNWNTSIDLTRNLTKFAPRTKASNSVPKRKNKKSSRTLANQSDFDDVEEIDQNAIIGVLLNKVDESRDTISGEANSSLEQSEVSQAYSNFLNPNCKFCSSICHCSPGRQLKR